MLLKIKWIIRSLSSVLLVFILLFSCQLKAWNYAGHVTIAQIAYNNLTPKAKKEADKLAKLAWQQLPEYRQEKLELGYPGVSQFAKLAPLPDMWRKQKLATLFKSFNASVPAELSSYSEQSTALWHYVDNPYPADAGCSAAISPNVVWAIPHVEKLIKSSDSDNTRALMMIYLIHLVGDAHQPLHVVTHVDKQCQEDRGGNNFCLGRNSLGICTKNLHSLWDSGLGLFKPKIDIDEIADQIENKYPESKLFAQIGDIDPQAWVEAEKKFTLFIYDTPEDEKPSVEYYTAGLKIAEQQVALAGYRLGMILNYIFN